MIDEPQEERPVLAGTVLKRATIGGRETREEIEC